ncbi:cupin domain-containing protein [Kitasatospora sp. LaBMicrA B282]|uniref:cupin domain-containing protein n=1 Tax=Kitasatospora sp. LaBMicrA B282 TaxID=3420949 RepID=UPI003D0C84CF
MKVFRLDELDRFRTEQQGSYLRFLRESTMSAGLYALAPGEVDTQSVHRQDELYQVISGRGSLTVGEETCTVARGSVVFVPAGTPHRFHHITEELRVLVVFSPPET